MLGIKPIVVSKQKATREWKKHIEILKTRNDKHLKDLKNLYYQLSKGKKVIDIYEAFKYAGLNEKQEPRLAIVKADCKKVYFHKKSKGSGKFSHQSWSSDWSKFDVWLPEETFPVFEKKENEKYNWERLEASVPIIPAGKMPKGKLGGYFILWEVDDWKVVPKDPLLLKRITKNLFVVMETWNLTKLEQALIRGQ